MSGLGGDVGLMSNLDIITTGWVSPFSVILWHLINQRFFKIVAQNDLALSPLCLASDRDPRPWLSDIPCRGAH